MFNCAKIYTDVISDSKCQEFVDRFESDTEHQKVQDCGRGATLTQINLLHSPDTIWKDDVNFLVNVIMEHVEQYKKDCDVQPVQWPENFGVEPPKMKRYMSDTTDEFPDHVDVLDYKTAKRFLITFVYLNDNEGGRTKFLMKGDELISPCKRGSLIMFPPFWPWIHAAEKPINGPKYIAGTYLHYV